MEGKQIIAERSGVIAGRVVLWILAGLFFGGSIWAFIDSINVPEALPVLGVTFFWFCYFFSFCYCL